MEPPGAKEGCLGPRVGARPQPQHSGVESVVEAHFFEFVVS